jgi:hypothetical protein
MILLSDICSDSFVNANYPNTSNKMVTFCNVRHPWFTFQTGNRL